MSYEGYIVDDDYLYISFEGMKETKREINRSIEEAKEQRDDISRAIESLQVPDHVLRGYGDDLIPIKNSIIRDIDGLQRLNLHIDYVMRRFEEVDNEFAARFRAAGYEMRETLGLDRDSGIFGDFTNGLKSIVNQGAKAWCEQNKSFIDAAGIIFGAAKNVADQIGDWYEENKVVINNIATIALETLAIAGAVLAIGACALTPVGWVVLGVGLAVSASNIIDSGVKIYNYTQNGKEEGFNLIEKGFQAALGEETGSNVYTVVSVATGLYNVGKGAVTVAVQAKKFYTSVKSVNKAKDLISLGSGLGKAEDIVTEVSKLDKMEDTITGVSKIDNVDDSIKGLNKLDDAGDAVTGVKKADDVEDATKVARKTGVGVTGEGIPLEEVKPDVLKQIYPDDTGIYGYLPKEGTPYAKYDFTDVEKVKQNQAIREEYLEQSKKIQEEIDKVVQQGVPKNEIADKVVNMRNQDKIAARAKMSPEELAPIEARNMKLYKNPVGPTAKQLFKNNKAKLLEMNPDIKDEEVWDLVIKSSMKKDDVLNTLLGLKH